MTNNPTTKPAYMRSVMARGRKQMLSMLRYHGVSAGRLPDCMVAEVLWNLKEETDKMRNATEKQSRTA
jgi:hypothetical protein